MCHERYWLHRRDEAEESRRMWTDFERTEPLDEPERPEETRVEFAEGREEVAAER